MSASDNTEAKMDQSKDKGFIPLMQFLANTFNSQIVDHIDDEYCLMWVGIDEEDEDAKWNRYKIQIDSGVVQVAEVRKKEDMEEVLDEEGKPASWTLAPGNTVLMQVFMSELQAKQQAEQAEQQQAQQGQEQEQAQATSDDAHKKNLEVMDKQHGQSIDMQNLQHKHDMEGKSADQKHQTNIEAMKQKAAAKAKPGQPIKKSLNDDEPLEVIIDWADY